MVNIQRQRVGILILPAALLILWCIYGITPTLLMLLLLDYIEYWLTQLDLLNQAVLIEEESSWDLWIIEAVSHSGAGYGIAVSHTSGIKKKTAMVRRSWTYMLVTLKVRCISNMWTLLCLLLPKIQLKRTKISYHFYFKERKEQSHKSALCHLFSKVTVPGTLEGIYGLVADKIKLPES